MRLMTGTDVCDRAALLGRLASAVQAALTATDQHGTVVSVQLQVSGEYEPRTLTLGHNGTPDDR